MKTLLIVVSKTFIKRNILDTDFWPILRNTLSDVRIVLVVGSDEVSLYKKQFAGAENMVIEGYGKPPFGLFGRIVMYFVRSSLKSDSMLIFRWRAYKEGDAGFLPTAIALIISRTLGRINWWKRVVRAMVLRITPPDRVLEIIDRYKPDQIFTLSLIDSAFDVPFAIAAKQQDIPLAGMVRSWDNLNNHGLLAVIPDKFYFQNIWLSETAEKLQGIDLSKVAHEIVGVPHYDFYSKNRGAIIPRNQFLAELGIDSGLKLILFCGPDTSQSPDTVPRILDSLIETLQIKYPAHVVLRPHPAYLYSPKEFDAENLPNVTLDSKLYEKGHAFSPSDSKRYINLLAHADIVINVASTVSIDAAVFDKPVICINFDSENKSLPWVESVHRLYDHLDHYERIVQTGGVRLAWSPESLASEINRYLDNPHLEDAERKEIVRVFVGLLDGQAGKRLAESMSEFYRRHNQPLI